MLSDSHIHLDQMSASPAQVRRRMGSAYRALIPGLEPAQIRAALGIWGSVEGIACAAAIHPWWTQPDRGGHHDSPQLDPRWEEVVALAHTPLVSAIGETGLDHYRFKDEASRARAARYFRAHVELAIGVGKPLVIHCVRAHAPCLQILAATGAKKVGGIVHAFAGSAEEAEAYCQQGFLLGIGCAVTRPHAKRVRQIAANIPLPHLVLETDAPYMFANNTAGRRRGEPEDIQRVAETVAQLRGLDPETLQVDAARGLQRLLGSPPPPPPQRSS